MICNKCGNAVEHDVYFCEKCGNRVRKEKVEIDRSQLKGMALWEENPIFGTVGALLGSVAGVAIFYQWFMFFGTQFLAPIPGGVMGALIACGYWWLGKRLRGVGTVISVVLVLLSGWLANHIFWTMVIFSNGISGFYDYWNVFLNLGRYIDAGDISLVYYIMGMLSIYFGAFVAVAISVGAYRTFGKA